MSVTHTEQITGDNAEMFDVSSRAWNRTHTVTGVFSPDAHAGDHENAGSDEIDLTGLAGQEVTVPNNSLIANNLTEADLNKHTLDLAAALTETRTIVSLVLRGDRQAGTGDLLTYPNEGAVSVTTSFAYDTYYCIIAAGTNRLEYSLSVINDVFDLYCLGYVVVED